MIRNSKGSRFGKYEYNQQKHQISHSLEGLPSIDMMRSVEIEGSKPKKFQVTSGKKRANFFDDVATE